MYLGIDSIAAAINKVNPETRVVGLADSGFFPDYNSPYNSTAGKVVAFGTDMRDLSELMNISAGADRDCVKAFRHIDGARTRCIFAENLIPYITTPIFATQVI